MSRNPERLTGTFVNQILPQARTRLVTIDADAALVRAAELLFEASRHMVIVCDARGSMIGVVTKTDIVRQISLCDGHACTVRCATVMTKPVIACRPSDRLEDIWSVMKETGLHNIPVVDSQEQPVGLLSARDALEALLSTVENEEALLRDYVMCVGYH